MTTGGGGEKTGVGGGGGGNTGGEGGGGVGKEGTKGEHLKELQSTGLDKNELHWPADFCSGLPGKQFILSSKSSNPKHTGGSPVK